MQQKTSMCVWLAGLLSLPISGLLELPVRAADDTPKQVAKTKEEPAAAEAVPAQDDKAKADEPKDKAARAKANEDAKAALGALINLAVGAAKARPANVQGLRVNEVQVNEAQLKQFEQQYGRHFQQLFRTEMHFIRMVCKPTKQQYDKISGIGDASLKTMIREFARQNFQRMRGGFRAGQQPAKPTSPRARLAQELAKAVKTTLSAEQTAAYVKELERREAARKRAAVLVLAAYFDGRLVLTAEQRDKFRKMLEDNWNDSWGESQRLMNLQYYAPAVADSKVLPILNTTQKDVWRSMRKQNNVHFGFNVGFIQGVQIEEEEEWVGEEQPAQGKELAEDATQPKQKAEEKP